MNKIYLFQTLMVLAKGMVAVFAPLYLYNSGYLISTIFIFHFLFSVILLLAIPVALRIIQKIGFKYCILLSIPFFLGFPVSLNFIEVSWIYPMIGYIFLGLHASLYWPAFHCEIAASGTRKKQGAQIGTLQIVTKAIAMFVPFITGAILAFLGYTYLFFISTILLFLGTLPLILAKDIPIKKPVFRYKDYIRIFKQKKHSKAKIAFAAEGIDFTLFLYGWAIILFIILGNDYVRMGALLTFVSVLSIIIITYLKRKIDHQDKNKFLNFSVKLYSFGWFLRAISILTGGFFVHVAEALSRIFVDIFRLPYTTVFYNNARKADYIDYIMLRELCYHLAKMIFLIPLILVMIIVQDNIILFFIMTLIASIVAMGKGYLREE